MSDTFKHIINMANSIIGVSILSMPYCFKEAGLVLGILLILLSGFITKKTCMFLIRAAIMSRRRSYELLAFQVFGVPGKLLMELCMILFLIGICISFHVVMGDLAPAIVAKYMIIENSPSLRCTLLVGMVLLVILPLCLLRNLDSLASMSACSIGFYVFLNCIIFYMALPNLLDGSWFSKAKLFHFDSAFRILPIMTLALSCQSNVFEIYDSIPDPDVIKMKNVVSQAVNICCALYIGVGFMGYIAFIDTDVTGNIILKFPVSNMTDCITMFFVVSLAISFPLMMFPCRTSIHSLLYKRNTQISYDLVGNYMPESRFKGITLSVLVASLIIGILLPNIEFVLGLLGSTMGVTISLILPSVFYIRVYTKTSCDRLLAQGFFLMGIFIMVTGTYLHLAGLQNTGSIVTLPPDVKHMKDIAKNIPVSDVPQVPAIVAQNDEKVAADLTGRKEPVIPEPPNSDQETEEKKPVKSIVETVIDKKPAQEGVEANLAKDAGDDLKEAVEQSMKLEEGGKIVKKDVKEEDKREIEKNDVKEDILHPDAIRKEEKENLEEAQGKTNIEDKQEKILKQMEHQQKEQKKLIEEQKKILQELKDQKEKIEEIKPELKIKEELKQIPLLSIGDQIVDPKALKIENANVPIENVHPNIEIVAAKPVENIPVKPVENLLQKSVNLSELPVDNAIQIPVENLPSKTAENVPQKPVENIPQKPVGNMPQKPVENMPQKPVENMPQKPVENMPQKPVENMPHKPVENIPSKPVKNLSIKLGEKLPQKLEDLPQNFMLEDQAQKVDLRGLKLNKKLVKDNVLGVIPYDLKSGFNSNLVQEAPQELNILEKPSKAVFESPQDISLSRKDSKPQPAMQQPAATLKKLNVDTGKGQNDIKSAASDPKLLKIGKHLPEGNKAPPEDPTVKHDEERRKRDVSSVEEEKETKDAEVHIQKSDKLSFDAIVNFEDNKKVLDSENKNIDALFETRHLLWLKRGRRRKRRNEQFPEYWDEI